MNVAGPLRQAKAFFVLLVRHWARSGIAGSRVDRFRKGSAFLVRVVVVFFYAGFGRRLGEASLENAASGMAGAEWLVAALLGFSACWGMMTRGRALRGMALPLSSSLIDSLPVFDAVRTLAELVEVGLPHVLAAGAFAHAAPALPVVAAAALGVGASVVASLFGAALMRWAFVAFSPERSLSLTQVSAFAQAVFLGLGFAAQIGGTTVRLPFLSPLARPIAGEGGLAGAFGFVGASFLFVIAALAAAERVGYDRTEVVPHRSFAKVPEETLSIGAIDELLSRREPGARRWPFLVFGALALVGLGAVLMFENGSPRFEVALALPSFFVGWTAWMALQMAAGISARAVARDLVARPLLAALPIEPQQLLQGKIAVVRRRLLIGLLPLAFGLLSPLPRDLLVEFAWRSAAVLAGAWMYASGAVSVAFLTGGAQTSRPQPGGTFRLESLLLLVPLTALLVATSPWLTLVPLASLALVTFEARRAATRVARWLDDGEDFERETPEWRAALAFSAFQGSQVLAARLVSAWTADAGILMGASYGISGVILVALTSYGRRDLAPLKLWPRNPIPMVIALASGVGTATLGRHAARWLLSAETLSPTKMSDVGKVAFLLTAGTVAPLVEEVFFRGWLQHVVAHDLTPRRKWLAPVVAALAFASVHPPASFIAVFPLGLVVGALYARTGSLAPCIVAHAAHNWTALLFQ